MPEENLPPQIRQLTKAQLLERIPEIRAAVMASAEGLTRLQKAHLVQLLLLWETYQQQELEELDVVIERVKKAELQSEAFRSALLWDLRGYAGASAEDRRKTKDRVFKALAGRPPEDKKITEIEGAVKLGGKEYMPPDRFKDE